MTTIAQISRPPHHTMTNGNGDKIHGALGSTFVRTTWGQSTAGIWSKGLSSSSSAQAISDDAFQSGPTGSSTLAAASPADPWASRPGTWSSYDSQSRKASGSTSPTTQRRDVDMPPATMSFFTSAPAAAALAPRPAAAGVRARSKLSSTLDPAAPSKLDYALDMGDYYADEKENHIPPFGTTAAADYDYAIAQSMSRSSDASYLNPLSNQANNNHSALPPPLHHAHPDPAFSADFSYGPTLSSRSIPQPNRSSSSQPTSSFAPPPPQQTGLPPPYTNNDYNNNTSFSLAAKGELLNALSALNLNQTPSDAANGHATAAAAESTQSRPLNPASRPWEATSHSSAMSASARHSPATTATLPPLYLNHKHPGPFDSRSSTPRGASRQSIGSPDAFNAATPLAADAWSRPPSRDVRIAASHLDPRRVPDHPAFSPPTPSTYFIPNNGPPFYDMYNSAQSFQPPPLYGAAFPPAAAPPHFRQPMPLPGYGLPFHPYLTVTASLPNMRPSRDVDPGRGVRSPLLEEFRSSTRSSKRYELKDIYHHIVEFSGDQHGSRFIQQKLETASSDEKDQVFSEIEANAIPLMKDVFGNYVIQKFFEHGNQVQKKVLAGMMKGKVVELSAQMYACRVVQKALEHVLVEQQAELVAELQLDVLRIVKDQNGNHVIQKIIELVPRQYIGFIMDCLHGKVCELASHTYGCRVIQRVLEHGSDADKAAVMAELHACAQLLITDQYGNYVTQHVIQHGQPHDRSRMIDIVTKQLLTLSKHKFASNVVEKCIEYGTSEERRSIRLELTAQGGDGASPLQIMMKDQYGNYVIQKLLGQLEGCERQSFVEEMRPQFISLKKVSMGRQIAAIDRLISVVSTPPATPRAGASTSASSSIPQSPALPRATSPPTSTVHPPTNPSSPPRKNDSFLVIQQSDTTHHDDLRA